MILCTYGAGHLGRIASRRYGDEARRAKNSTPEVPDPYQALRSAEGEDIVWSGWKHPVATMAKEMMEFTKNNIISQAATAMLEGLAA
jgi:hypothetical protein